MDDYEGWKKAVEMFIKTDGERLKNIVQQMDLERIERIADLGYDPYEKKYVQ